MVLRSTHTHSDRPFDLVGFLTVATGLVCCLYVLGEGSNIDWGDITNVLLMVFGIFCLIMFVVNELHHPHPMLDIRVFKYFPFTMSMIISSILTMALMGVVFIMPLFLQNLRGQTAMQTGILMFPSAVATGIMMPISGKLYDKFGAKPVVMPGLVLLVFATWELSKVNMSTPLFTISMLMALRGLALGISMMPITTEGMNAVPLNKVAEASSINNAIRQVAGSLSITILTTVMQNFQDNRYAQLAVAVTPFNAQMNSAVSMMKGLMLQHRLNPNGAWVIVAGLLKQQAFV
jgi:EmrB/QacA subfamily drug resistance transporter